MLGVELVAFGIFGLPLSRVPRRVATPEPAARSLRAARSPLS
jgi:hypothetical protein